MSPSTSAESVHTSEIQAPTTIDGTPIAQLQPGDEIYFRSNEQGPWGVHIFRSYDPTTQSAHLGTERSTCLITISLSHCSATRPTEGVVLGTAKEQQAYALDCSIEKRQMLDAVSDPTRQGIQALLRLELAGIDPEKFLRSYEAECPTTDSKEKFQPNQQIFKYKTTGTYVPATIIRKIPNASIWEIQLSDSSVIEISQHFIRSQLPKGKRACHSQRQIDMLDSYRTIKKSGILDTMDTASRNLMLTGLAQALLKAEPTDDTSQTPAHHP